VRRVPEMPGVPGSDAAGLRAANARLRELLAGRYIKIAVLREQPTVLARPASGAKAREENEGWFRQAAATGIGLNAARKGKLQQKRHALATRMENRQADCLRFARGLGVPFDSSEAERAIRMASCGSRIPAARAP
jgi:hypothetical protein